MKKRGWAAAACALSLLLTCCAAPAPSGAESAPEAQATPEPQRQAFDLPFEMVSSPDLTAGDYKNLKITTPEDLAAAGAFLEQGEW